LQIDILVAIDIYSHYVWTFRIENKSSNIVAQCLQHIFDELNHRGIMLKSIQSDNGKEFMGNVDVFTDTGIS
jgi:IS30 family transposase